MRAGDRMMNLQYQGQNMEYSLQQSRRKTIAICIERDLKILVKAPLQVSEQEIQRIVEKKAGWIVKKREELAKHQTERQSRQLSDGRRLFFQGEPYSLRIITGEAKKKQKTENRVEISGKTIIVYTDQESQAEVYHNLIQWYYEMARQLIYQRTSHYNERLKESINRIRIKNQRSLWGSCSSKRNLNFNWRIILAPPEVADYVVVHEMCHLRHLNHSPEFWAEVEGILPDYKSDRQWLREHGNELMEVI